MSWWTYVQGTIKVSPLGRTQAEKRYILETVLNHLPLVTGSERDMDIHIVQPNGHNNSSSFDEFGDVTNNLVDRYGQKSRSRGWLKTQDEYILVVDGALRDREFSDTYREFQKWLCRLAKRVMIEDVLVEIKGYCESSIIRNTNGVYYEMFELPSWSYSGLHKHWKLNKKLSKFHDKSIPVPNWCEYLMWERMDNCKYPRLLGYKYFDDEENDKKVESWFAER